MKYFCQLKETVTSVKSDSPLICWCPFSCSSSPQHRSHHGFTNTPLAGKTSWGSSWPCSGASLSLVGPRHRQTTLMWCSIKPLSSDTTTSEEAAWEQGERVGIGRSSSDWLFWHMQWQWCTNAERHKPPWMQWPWETHKALLMLLHLSWS